MSEPLPNPPEDKRPPDGLELICDGILRSEFGRCEFQGLARAMRALRSEEAARRSRRGRLGLWYRHLTQGLPFLDARIRFALGALLMLITALAVWSIWSFERGRFQNSQSPVCILSDAINARWAGSGPQFNVNDTLPSKTLHLESGIAELAFASSAKVAIEGPAKFKLTGFNSMELEQGIVSVQVPRHAIGFKLKTPTAAVVDLGTRFGAVVGADHASEVDVFQGRVELATDASRGNSSGRWLLSKKMAVIVDGHEAVEATALPESAFPQPNLMVEVRPQNCGFDVSGRAALGNVPTDFGYWSGAAYLLVGAGSEVRPYSSKGMLQFLDDRYSPSGDSEVWQLIDLGAYKEMLESGNVEARLSTWFNRAGVGAPGRFGLALAAFAGQPTNTRSLWMRRSGTSLALDEGELATDNDPLTWEKLEVAVKLPPATDYVIIELRAIGTKGVGEKPASFSGHFADLVEFHLSTPLRGRTITAGR